MRLYDEELKNTYVWAVKGEREPPAAPCSFETTKDESAQNIGVSSDPGKNRMKVVVAHQVPMGRYNSEGLYETFCPGIPGGEGARGLNRYVLHPLAEAERDREKAQKEKANSWQRRAA